MALKQITSIILIDDNEVDTFINQKILESFGVTDMLAFSSTTKALHHLKQTTHTPQLIFLDICLPLMNGFDFLNELGKMEIAKQPIDIYILTNSINPIDKETARRKKCAGFILKPLTIEKLSEYFETEKDKQSLQ